jgi:serine/threonine-protein kinase RsbW
MAGRPRKPTAKRSDEVTQTVLHGPSTHESVEALTDRVVKFLEGLPLEDTARFRLKLAVHEALTNAAEHGNKSDPAKQLTVTCRFEPRQVSVTIDDEGDGFNPACVPDCTAAENLLRESGRGIFLVRCYADECRFENAGRRIVLVKHLP